jgi:hypothetical protein
MGGCQWASDVGVPFGPGAKQRSGRGPRPTAARGGTGTRVDINGWPETMARRRSTAVNPHWRIAQQQREKQG